MTRARRSKAAPAVLLLALLVAFAPAGLSSSGAVEQRIEWRLLERGLELARFASPRAPVSGDGLIAVLRIDTSTHELRLLSASEQDDGRKRTIREWSRSFGLVAAVNAGMYQEDGVTSVGHMKNFGHFNNRHVNPFKAVLAFNPTDPALPPVQIIDRECQDFEVLRERYQTLVQSIRMVSCRRQNVWSQQASRWSIALLAIDDSGRILVIFTRSPYSVHDFIEIILSLPLSIHNAMYLEGGAEAALYVSAGEEELELHGGYGSGTSAGASFAWPLPNVIGVARK